VGEVWKWDLHLIHLLKVCHVLIGYCNLSSDPCFSRSNDYSDNLVSSPWKAILLTYVVTGKAKKFTTSQPMLTHAPVGFDSV